MREDDIAQHDLDKLINLAIGGASIAEVPRAAIGLLPVDTFRVAQTLHAMARAVPAPGAKDRTRAKIYQIATELDSRPQWRQWPGAFAKVALTTATALFVAVAVRNTDVAQYAPFAVESHASAIPGAHELTLVELDAQTVRVFLLEGADSAAATTTARITSAIAEAQRAIADAPHSRDKAVGFERLMESANTTLSQFENAAQPSDAAAGPAQVMASAVSEAYAESIEALGEQAPENQGGTGSVLLSLTPPAMDGPVSVSAYRVGPEGNSWVSATVEPNEEQQADAGHLTVSARLPVGAYTRVKVNAGENQTAEFARPVEVKGDHPISVLSSRAAWRSAGQSTGEDSSHDGADAPRGLASPHANGQPQGSSDERDQGRGQGANTAKAESMDHRSGGQGNGPQAAGDASRSTSDPSRSSPTDVRPETSQPPIAYGQRNGTSPTGGGGLEGERASAREANESYGAENPTFNRYDATTDRSTSVGESWAATKRSQVGPDDSPVSPSEVGRLDTTESMNAPSASSRNQHQAATSSDEDSRGAGHAGTAPRNGNAGNKNTGNSSKSDDPAQHPSNGKALGKK